MTIANRCTRVIAVAAVAVALASCGGGNDAPTAAGAQACSPNNPFRADATAPTQVGSLTAEKNWLRQYVDINYLWYDKVPNVDPSNPRYSSDTTQGFYASIDEYFLDLTRPLTNPAGKPEDRFSFTYPTLAWDQLINSGTSIGYGIEWRFGSPTPPRSIRVVYVHTGSAAAQAGVLRGDTLVLADNVSADANDQAGVDVLNAAIFPAAGTVHSFRFSRAGAGSFDVQDLPAGNVALQSVEHRVIAVGPQNVGYLLFNDHVLTAEQPLINAVQALANANVSDLVVDLRYNGGGYLYMASQLAYMIAGANRTTAAQPPKVFERTVFSNKRSNENASETFWDVRCLPHPVTFQCQSPADPLPALNLSRVYVLTSASTCSASEAIINGLRGVDIEVRLIGSTTCGKPFGFFGQDNCGITYFPIEFQGVNDKGFGDYANGFIPGGTGTPANSLPGCAANDDLGHQLGDPAEGQLAAALSHRTSVNNGSPACPPLMASGRVSPLAAASAERGTVAKAAARSNRYGRMPLR